MTPLSHHTYQEPGITLTLSPLVPERDTHLIHAWLTSPTAQYWHMGHYTLADVAAYVEALSVSEHEQGWVVYEHDVAVAYVETYDPSRVLLTQVVEPQPGDMGMHLLKGPAPKDKNARRSGFTRSLLSAAVDLCTALGATRVLVEPDANNAAIIKRNHEVGFQPIRVIDLPDKRALLSVYYPQRNTNEVLPLTPAPHLSPEHMEPAQRHLVAKALAEFAHEHLIVPTLHPGFGGIPDARYEAYWVASEHSVYTFTAQKLELNHWVIDEDTLQRLSHDGEPRELNAQDFIIEFNSQLDIPERLLGTYLEEIASTLAGGAYKHFRVNPTAQQLAEGRTDLDPIADYQHTEASMTEGHPCFVATNGRLGFSLDDYFAFAPETGATFRYIWLAARREHAHLALSRGLSEGLHWERELTPTTLAQFERTLRATSLSPDDYTYMPVHPWQFRHKIAVSYAPDIARNDLVVLGETPDEFQPQQSIRTAFNRSRPETSYIKTALSIQNMGFLRGLSPEFMRYAPAISDWVAETVRGDEVLRHLNFDVLCEHAAIGYTGGAYHQSPERLPHKKMLSALWRESPAPLLNDGERLLTMASLLHRDRNGRSLATALVQCSGLSPREWLTHYMTAYLAPLVHCLETHAIAFMPHGENLILRVTEGRVTGVLMKDLGEEIGIVAPRDLPEDLSDLQRLQENTVPEQAIFTDVFVGFFRHLAGILHADRTLDQNVFWAIVRNTIATYTQGSGPKLLTLDLAVERFEQSCHNRLQLKNTLEMVNLQDTASSLIYTRSLANPIGK